MRLGTTTAATLLAMWAVLPCAGSDPAESAQRDPDSPYRVETLVEGIHLFRPVDPASGRTNSLVVEREDGLLVVDAQPTPDAARDLLAGIASRFDRPVRFLVLTHPHADAAGGASAFPPSVLILASQGFQDAIQDPAYDFGAEARERAAGGEAYREPPRVSPTILSWAPVHLEDRRHRVEILPIAKLPAHSDGDLTVWVPDAGVLAAGDLVWPSPAAYIEGASVANWVLALGAITELRPTWVVSLRGPAGDARASRALREGFAWIRGQVEQSFVDGIPTGRIPDHVLQSPQAGRFLDLESAPNRARRMVEGVVADVLEYRRKYGID